jgi:hypothetical protein
MRVYTGSYSSVSNAITILLFSTASTPVSFAVILLPSILFEFVALFEVIKLFNNCCYFLNLMMWMYLTFVS